GHTDQLADCHLCGLCSAKFYDVDCFIEHKRTCCTQKQKSITPPCSDTESTPIDLSRKSILDDLDNNKNVLEDKSNVLFDPISTLQQHQQQLLELYAQLAASQGVKTDSEQSSEDGRNPSYLLSPPSSNDAVDKIHPCAAERCTQRFSSRGALLWHVLRRHPDEKLLQCENCDERFMDPDQVREHQCGVAPRSASTGALLRSTSPDVDRGSVPARTDGPFSVVCKSPSPAPNLLSTLTPSTATGSAPFSQMLFSQLLNSVSSAAVAANPSTPASKDIALDLSTSINNTPPFMPLPPMPQHYGPFSVVCKSPSPAPNLLSTLTPSTATGSAPFSQMLFSQLLNSVSSAAVAANPSTPASKDIALDLSTSINNTPPFMPLPPMPQHLMRPPINFSLNAHRSPHPDSFMGNTPSNSLLTNDDDWEALMEVSTTDEAEKIRALVGDKALPTTDPNQCLLCRRVLSCKSALQMHYRTHTGERPFKCKICQRAFTTKGNLKTHMGVHRAKHSFRGIGNTPNIQHQCPICQKRFFTAQLLQQHIAQHTNQLTRNSIMPPFENSLSSPSFERRSELGPTSSGVVASTSQSLLQMNGAGLIRPLSNGMMPPFPTPFPFFPLGLPRPLAAGLQQQQQHTTYALPSLAMQASPSSTAVTNSRPPQTPEGSEAKIEVSSPPLTPSHSEALGTSVNLQSVLNTAINDVLKKEEPERKHSQPSAIPSNNLLPNTLCNICFKTFACQSALEIHYRSHTKDRPFKCSECGRGFSTKGNMKQHMLTHRIRCTQSPDDGSVDESLAYEEMDQSEPSSSSGRFAESESEDRISQQQQSHSQSQTQIQSQPTSPAQQQARTSVEQSSEQPQTSAAMKEKNDLKSSNTIPPLGNTPNPLDAMQKMWAETEPPPPRQAPVLSKHQCGVCFKHFSSSSALQIHMRTHTGDKPFKCEVCGRAFTTRGNLKVHMGTHMWQQNPSRRGRRIFEFGADGALHPELLSPLGAIGPETPIRQSFESPLRPPFPDPIRSGPPAFPGLPFPLPLLPTASGGGGAVAAAAAAASSQMDAVMWMWRTVCSVCQKVCASPHELEQHLKMHLNGTAGTNSTSSPTMLLQKSD
ncbi:Sal-like protein 3, partial [Toxocara canis]